MDKQTIAERNQRMIGAYHRSSIQHIIRRIALRTTTALPFPLQEHTPDRILLIRPDHLGDVLLTTPAIQRLKATHPDTEIHVLVGPWAAEVLADYPEIDLILTVEFPGFNRNGEKKRFYSPYIQLLRVARQLRQVGYHSAFILRPDHWWGAMLAYFAGIPERIGYDFPDLTPFLTKTIDLKHEHAIVQNIRLVEGRAGEIETDQVTFTYPATSLNRTYVDELLTNHNTGPKTHFICIHPGSGTWAKRWTEGKWAKVADTLAGQMEARIVFTGSSQEHELIHQIMSNMEEEAIALVGETNIGQLAALYERALVVLGPDSGPMHLAVAVGTPTATLYGPADPVEFGPWGHKEKHIAVTTNIACRPCRVLDWGDDNPIYHPCVREITVGQVLEAARRAASYKNQRLD